MVLACFFWGQTWTGLITVVLDFLARFFIALIRPGLFMPVTNAKWTDLDQMAALILNGALPLGLSLWKISPRIRESLVVA